MEAQQLDCAPLIERSVGSNIITFDIHVYIMVATGANLRVYTAWFNDRTLQMFSDGEPINIH